MTDKKKLFWIGTAVFILLVAVVLVLLLQPSNARFSLGPGDAQLQVGQTHQFQILSEKGKAQRLSAVWSSQSDVVATVDENGLVTAVGAGETRITAQLARKGKAYSLSAVVTVNDPNQAVKVTMDGDATQEKPDFEGKFFTVYSATNGVTADMDAGTIQFSDEVKQTEVFFADSMNHPYSDAWELRGSINRENINQTLFLSFGVRDESGKEQWFCLYGTGLSRQRYWNWANTKYDIDNVHVGYNQAATSFYKRDAKADGNRLDFIAVVKNDVLKVYFGNRQEQMSLAWSLPLTKGIFGGFASNSKYQLGINTVDACRFAITDISCKNGEAVQDLGGIVGGKYADVKTPGDKFKIADSSIGVSYDGKQGTVDVKQTAKETVTFFAGNETSYADRWEFSGTIEKENLSDTVFLSFGIRDADGKEQWLCIYQNTLSLQKNWDWNETKQKVDGTYVKFNQPACSFFWKEKDMGAEKLNFKLILHDDVLTAYFGNDKYPLSQAWNLPLTNKNYGGFKPGSGYQIGIATVDPLNMHIKDIVVNNGDQAAQIPEFTEDGRFYIANQTVNVTDDPIAGTLEVAEDPDKSEIMFAASPYAVTSKAWQLTGTVTKKEMKNLFLSFGVKDKAGKEQWFCIYQKGLARQRYYNWADTKQAVDGKNVFANPASEHFFYKTPSLGGDKLHYAIIVQDDVLKAYFGNDQYDMTLAWYLPLTEETWGGFAPGTEYQLGINSVDPCLHTHTDVSVVTGDAVNDVWYKAQLYNVCAFEGLSNAMQEKMEASAKDNITTVFIGDSFFHQDAFFKNFSAIYRNKEVACVGISTTTTYHWESFTQDWLKDYSPKNIVVNVGTNNLILKPPYNSAETVTDGLQALLSRLQDTFPGTHIYWFSIAPRNDLDSETDKALINAAMKQWCDEHGVIYVESPITDPATDCVDGLHPTPQTYEKYAQALTAAGCEIVAADTSGYQFFVDTNSTGVTAKPTEGTITISNSASKTEIMLAADAESIYSETWQLTGTVTKTEMKNLFLSFGIRDAGGKEQWFCIYQKGLARQRYYNWADTKYEIDGKYVFANPASEHFFYKTPSLGGDKLHYKLVVRDDVLKAYFGNDQFDMTLAWELPLTEELWGGFASNSKYQLGINTVDPCAHNHSNVEVLTGEAVPEEEKPDYSNYKFFVDRYSNGVTAKPEDGTLDMSNSVSKTETLFKADAEETYSEKWQLTGTVTKKEMKNLFLSFGIRDENGKEQWLCIYNKGLSRQRYWNWADTKYDIDGKYVFANPASEHFFYKTPSLGGDKLHFKLVLRNDVLKAYFGNDQFDMTLAWELPLTDELWGGFTADSKYQLGINTVDPCAHSYTNVQVLTGDAVPEEETPDYSNYKFFVDSASGGVTADPEAGTITISNSVSKTETIFKVNAEETYSEKWQLTGTVTKKEMKNLFLSFGVRDESGKEQWFCVYKKGLARQRYWNWENTTYQPDGVYVIDNPASEHFYYKTPSLGGDKLHYKLVIMDDVLKAYFGNDQFDMTLAWELPLTEELWGGFVSGSKYQLGINTVDPCTHNHSNVQVLTGDAVVEEIPGESDQPESSEGQYLLYSEDFESYTHKVDLSDSTNDSGWIYSKKSANGYAYIENGKLYFAGSKYDVLYRVDGETWGNYTVEADISYNTDNGGWAALAYNVQSDTKWQKASVGTSGNVGLNGYNTKWTNNDSALNKTQLDKMGLANTAAKGQMRFKISVKNTSATLWVAQYHDGVLGNWSEGFTISNIYEDAQTGSIGFVSSDSSLGSIVVDNIKVYSDSLVTFAEDFDDYEGKVSLNAGDNSGAGKPGIFFHQGTNGATSYIQDGRLYLDASSKKSNYEHVYFTAGMNWTDYIVEMDLCTSADWIGMLHRVGGENNFQKAGVNIGGGTSLYGYTGVGKWQHNTAAPYKGTTTVKPSANQIYRLRVTVVNQEATLEIALYDANGVLGEYTQVLNASGLYGKHTKGSVGLMLNNNGKLKAWIDNVVVSRYYAGEIIQNTEQT